MNGNINNSIMFVVEGVTHDERGHSVWGKINWGDVPMGTIQIPVPDGDAKKYVLGTKVRFIPEIVR